MGFGFGRRFVDVVVKGYVIMKFNDERKMVFEYFANCLV